MTEKNRSRIINPLISLIISVAVVFIGSDIAGHAAQDKRLLESIDLKADKSYVDEQNKLQDEDNSRLERLFLFEIRELRKDLRLKKDKL